MKTNEELKHYRNDELDITIRVTKDENNQLLFCLKDLCDALKIANSRAVMKKLVKDEFCKIYVHPQGETCFVNEKGLNSILSRSNKQDKNVKKWITDTLVVSARKNVLSINKLKYTDLISFTNEELDVVIRGIIIDGKEYFVANDVAEALGYNNVYDAIRRHCSRIVFRIFDVINKEQAIKLIPEPDIYRLIFKSKLTTAIKFQDWVFESVLPSIRKTGDYLTPEKQRSVVDNFIEIARRERNERNAHLKTKEQLQVAMQEITKLQPFVKLFADEYNEHQKTKLRVFSLDDIEFNFSTTEKGE